MENFDQASLAMSELIGVIEQARIDDANEADTRFRIINALITDVLQSMAQLGGPARAAHRERL